MTDRAAIDIYTQWGCPYCTRAKALLDAKGVSYTEIDVTMDTAKRGEMATRNPGARTVPQIFVGERALGGCDDIHALDARGELDAILGL
jgi:glutaredoxin 3